MLNNRMVCEYDILISHAERKSMMLGNLAICSGRLRLVKSHGLAQLTHFRWSNRHPGWSIIVL